MVRPGIAAYLAITVLVLYASVAVYAYPSGTVLYVKQVPVTAGGEPPAFDLFTVHFPRGEPVSLFAKTPEDKRPKGKLDKARMLSGGRQVVMLVHTWRRQKPGYEHESRVYLLDSPSGKVTALAAGVHDADPFVVSPDRKAIIFPGQKPNQLQVWTIDGKMGAIAYRAGWGFGRPLRNWWIRWSPGMPTLRVKLVSDAGHTEKDYVIDIACHKLTPAKPSDPATNALDAFKGSYLKVDKSQVLWLLQPKGKRHLLARLRQGDEYWEDISGHFSPDGEYAFCAVGRSVGEPHIGWDSRAYLFDLRKARPALLTTENQQLYDFDCWTKSMPGFFGDGLFNVHWTSLPSLKRELVVALPPGCETRDLVEDP